jgi:hypothetical protein
LESVLPKTLRRRNILCFGTCAIQFATLADRKEHEKVVHKRQKKKQRDNDNIAVNLTTMDTCGDCDDEDA